MYISFCSILYCVVGNVLYCVALCRTIFYYIVGVVFYCFCIVWCRIVMSRISIVLYCIVS